LIDANKDQIKSVTLHGFIMGGRSITLFHNMKELMKSSGELLFLILNFHLVSGIDSGAFMNFIKLVKYCKSRKIFLIITNLSNNIEIEFRKWNIIYRSINESSLDHEENDENLVTNDKIIEKGLGLGELFRNNNNNKILDNNENNKILKKNYSTLVFDEHFGVEGKKVDENVMPHRPLDTLEYTFDRDHVFVFNSFVDGLHFAEDCLLVHHHSNIMQAEKALREQQKRNPSS